MQGWRRSMEDSFIASVKEVNGSEVGIFGVFDGHGGDTTSTFCRDYFVDHLWETRNDQPISSWGDVLINSFVLLDNRCYRNSAVRYEGSGSTAVCAVVKKDVVYVANAGDCRCILGQRKGPTEIIGIPLSVDHKPEMPTEKSRIEREGGVVSNGRINGVLAVSRGVGDFDFKTTERCRGNMVSVVPDVQTRVVGKDDEFLLLASDGLWECLSNDEVAQRLNDVGTSEDITKCVENLVDSCVASAPKSPGVDNITVVLIHFRKSK
eukprot:PhF_6_TR3341/c0_g1_i1/m.4719/K14803/PTC2_3; protein phosphatase PTC2/3